tara:strand:- start:2114 stop:2914 length:801 start_codon:yes stop_codon:yes gene_type:complete
MALLSLPACSSDLSDYKVERTSIPMGDGTSILSLEDHKLNLTPRSDFSDTDCFGAHLFRVESVNPTVLRCSPDNSPPFFIKDGIKHKASEGEYYTGSAANVVITSRGNVIFGHSALSSVIKDHMLQWTSAIAIPADHSFFYFAVDNQVFRLGQDGTKKKIIEISHPYFIEFFGQSIIENITYNEITKTIGVSVIEGGRGLRDLVFYEYDSQNDFSLLRKSQIEQNCVCRGELLSTDGETFELTYKGHERVYKNLRLTLKEGTNEDK